MSKKSHDYLVNNNPAIDIQINNIGHKTIIKSINKNAIGSYSIKDYKAGVVSRTPKVIDIIIKPRISPIIKKTLKLNLFLADIFIQSLIFNRISLNIKLIILYVFLPFRRLNKKTSDYLINSCNQNIRNSFQNIIDSPLYKNNKQFLLLKRKIKQLLLQSFTYKYL